MVRFFRFTFPVFPLKSKNPTVLHVFAKFILQVRVILLDSLTWFHKYSKKSLSVKYVTKWNPSSIFQTNTGDSVGFSKFCPGQGLRGQDVFRYTLSASKSDPREGFPPCGSISVVAAAPSLPSTVASCFFLFFWFCHLFGPPEQSSASEIKLTKTFSSLVQLPEMNILVKRFTKCWEVTLGASIVICLRWHFSVVFTDDTTYYGINEPPLCSMYVSNK